MTPSRCRFLKSIGGPLALTAAATSAAAAPAPSALMPEKQFAVFENYCLDCHDRDTEKGKVNLEDLSFDIAKDIPTAEVWDDILAALNSKEMPPEDKEQIPDDEKAQFLKVLSDKMVITRNILADSGGEITIRRLNRREYQNTLESLLGFAPDVSDLPADDDTGGFDTSGASLFFSPDQWEQYRATAADALRLALTPRKKPGTQVYRVEGEESITAEVVESLETARDSVARAQAFLGQEGRPPTDFGFRDVGHAEKQAARAPSSVLAFEAYLAYPESATGAVLHHHKNRVPSLDTPKLNSLPGGRYLLRFRAGHYPGSPAREQYLSYRLRLANKGLIRLGEVKVTGTIEKPSTHEIPITIPAGLSGSLSVTARDYATTSSRKHINDLWRKENGIGQPPSLWVDYIEVEGPTFDQWPPPAQAELLPGPTPGEPEANYARRLITSFATHAFRGRGTEKEFVDKLVARYLEKSGGGETRLDAAIDTYTLVLSSPSFLYMAEPHEGEEPAPLTGPELAVRLSYFLWGAPPDEELMDLAKAGTLSGPTQLKEQAERLLRDPRADEFIAAFSHQWLDMARVDMFDFDARYHPQFDEEVRQGARQEFYQTIGHVIDENLPLETLLKADFILANDVLADFYGIPGVEGPEFQKVSLPTGSPRGGLLGAAATHIMGSDGQRSSPVERGAWVLRHLLHDPPPPPPANVPMLEVTEDKILPIRELQKTHQEEPQCAQCHQKIDPIGYGLENFTAAGLWREQEEVVVPLPEDAGKNAQPAIHTFPIDPSGTLPTGETFDGYFGLRDAIATHHEEFSRGFAEHLIAYALGRPFGISDYNLATDITKQAAQNGNTIPAFIHALIDSDAFKCK